MKTVRRLFLLLLSFSPSFGWCQEVSTLAQVNANGGVSVAENGTLYVAHFGPLPIDPSIGNALFSISPNGSTAALPDIELSVGSGNDIDAEGFLYQSNFATGNIFKIDLGTEMVVETFPGISGPVGIAVGDDNNLYVCGCADNTVKKISPDGTIAPFAAGSAFNCANGITAGPDGNFYTTNFSDGRVTKISPGGSTETIGSTPSGNGHIAYRAIDESLYIASYSGHQIFKMDLDGNVELFAGTGNAQTINSTNPLEAAFNKPNGIRFSPDFCSLYITQNDEAIREIKFTDSECNVSATKIEDGNATINIYPNPTSLELFIETTTNMDIIAIELYNASGKLMSRSDSGLTRLNIEQFPFGLYHVIVTTKTGKRYSNSVVFD